MSHITIIINSVPPTSGGSTLAPETGPCATSVTYTPVDGMTSAQIGNRVAEILKKVSKIEQEE